MSKKRVLVTGPTGFIGINLVKTLLSRGCRVTAMVRATSDTSALQRLGVRIVEADLGDVKSLAAAVADQQVIYHLAAAARAVHLSTFNKVNLEGLSNLMNAAIAEGNDPKLVLVSTLAAVGPSPKTRPHCEEAIANPISNYGKSKRAAELLAAQYSDHLNVSIVRPSIVLGPHDVKGWEIFKTISQFGIHFIPGLKMSTYSVIHVSDLCAAMIAVAERGRRVTPKNLKGGTYFTAADEMMTYAELGRLISHALGKPRTINFPIFSPILKLIGGVNTLIGNLRGTPQFLNYDKVRDVTAGSWACENKKLKQELGFEFSTCFATRMAQTVEWYRKEGWLASDESNRSQPVPVGSTGPTGRRPNGPTMNVN